MAGGIKGITVKIGGDTTELGKALTSATTKSTELQKELKGVNTLLKFDTGNVTLLKQKQDLLTASIKETQNKLNALKEVLSQADSGQIQMTEEEYRNLQREIASTENKLKSLQKQQDDFGSVGAQKIADLGRKFEDLGSKIETAGEKISVISGATGALLGASTKFASDYTDGVAKVGTVADTSAVSLEQLSSDMLDLSTQTGKSANEIADATYQAISASVDTADAVSFVGQASDLARAGFLDTASAVDVLTTIINAYGLQADEASRLSDVLIQTQNDGKTTVNELSQSMGQVIPLASAYGVNIENLATSYAELTKNGVKTSQAGTYIRSMLKELGDTGSDVSEILQNETGMSFAELMEDGKSLGDILGILSESVDGDSTAFANLWSSSEAGTGALSLLSSGVDEFNDELAKMGQASGNVSDALETLDTPSAKLNKSINALKNTAIELGQVILEAITPMLTWLSERLQDLFNWFKQLDPAIQKIIAVVLAVITALGPVLIIVGKVVGAVGKVLQLAPKIVSGVKSVGAVFGGLSAPILAIVGAIGVLVGAFVTLWQNNEDFRNRILEIWENLRSKISEFISGIQDRLSGLSGFFETVSSVIRTIWQGLCDFLAPVFIGVFEIISGLLSAVLDVITGILDVFIGIFTGNWDQFCLGLQEIIVGILDAIVAIFSGAWDAIKGAVEVFLAWFGTNWENVWNSIKSFISDFWKASKKLVSDGLTAIKNTITDVLTTIRNTFNSVIDAIKTFLQTSWNNIKSTATNTWNAIRTSLTDILENIKSKFSEKIEAIKNKAFDIWDAIKNKTSEVWQNIKNFIEDPINTAKATFQKAINSMRNALNFHWSLPDLKLPHISVYGGRAPFGIGGRGSLPYFDIQWYKDGAIFKKPTLFNTPFGMKGVGEDGPEAVAPIGELMGYVDKAVNSTRLAEKMDKIEKTLDKYMPKLATPKTVVLDTGVMVGEMIDEIDTDLSDKNNENERGW